MTSTIPGKGGGPSRKTPSPYHVSAQSPRTSFEFHAESGEYDDTIEEDFTQRNEEERRDAVGVRYITETLLKKMARDESLECISKLTLTLNKEGGKKIKYIENLERLRNLTLLNLSCNQIEKIEKLDRLTQLKELNLSFNCIVKIENLESLVNLQVLNLTGNRILHVPAWLPKKLKALRAIKLAKNRIQSLHHLANLYSLSSLTQISIADNPVTRIPHHRLFLIFHLTSIELVDGVQVEDEERSRAKDRFEQDELTRFRLMIEEKDRSLRELTDLKKKYETESKIRDEREKELHKKQRKQIERVQQLEDELQIKDQLLKQKTDELTKACRKHYELEQDLAFHKIDAKFESLGRPPMYNSEGDSDVDMATGDSSYIGKSRYTKIQLAQLSAAKRLINVPTAEVGLMSDIKMALPPSPPTREWDEEEERAKQQRRQKLSDTLDKELQDKQTAIVKAQTHLSELQSELKNTEKLVLQATLDLNRLANTSPLGLSDEEKSDLRDKLGRKVALINQLRQEADLLNEQIDTTEEDIMRQQGDVDALRHELERINDVTDPKYQRLHREMVDKEQQVAENTRLYQDLQHQLDDLMTTIKKETEEIRDLEKRLFENQATQNEQLREELEEIIGGLNEYLNRSKKEALHRQEDFRQLVREKEDVDRQLSDVAEARRLLEEELAKAIAGKDKAEAVNRRINDANEELQNMKRTLAQSRRQAEEEREELLAELDEERARVDELLERAGHEDELRAELADLEEAYHQLQEKMESGVQFEDEDESEDSEDEMLLDENGQPIADEEIEDARRKRGKRKSGKKDKRKKGGGKRGGGKQSKEDELDQDEEERDEEGKTDWRITIKKKKLSPAVQKAAANEVKTQMRTMLDRIKQGHPIPASKDPVSQALGELIVAAEETATQRERQKSSVKQARAQEELSTLRSKVEKIVRTKQKVSGGKPVEAAEIFAELVQVLETTPVSIIDDTDQSEASMAGDPSRDANSSRSHGGGKTSGSSSGRISKRGGRGGKDPMSEKKTGRVVALEHVDESVLRGLEASGVDLSDVGALEEVMIDGEVVLLPADEGHQAVHLTHMLEETKHAANEKLGDMQETIHHLQNVLKAVKREGGEYLSEDLLELISAEQTPRRGIDSAGEEIEEEIEFITISGVTRSRASITRPLTSLPPPAQQKNKRVVKKTVYRTISGSMDEQEDEEVSDWLVQRPNEEDEDIEIEEEIVELVSGGRQSSRKEEKTGKRGYGEGTPIGRGKDKGDRRRYEETPSAGREEKGRRSYGEGTPVAGLNRRGSSTRGYQEERDMNSSRVTPLLRASRGRSPGSSLRHKVTPHPTTSNPNLRLQSPHHRGTPRDHLDSRGRRRSRQESPLSPVRQSSMPALLTSSRERGPLRDSIDGRDIYAQNGDRYRSSSREKEISLRRRQNLQLQTPRSDSKGGRRSRNKTDVGGGYESELNSDEQGIFDELQRELQNLRHQLDTSRNADVVVKLNQAHDRVEYLENELRRRDSQMRPGNNDWERQMESTVGELAQCQDNIAHLQQRLTHGSSSMMGKMVQGPSHPEAIQLNEVLEAQKAEILRLNNILDRLYGFQSGDGGLYQNLISQQSQQLGTGVSFQSLPSQANQVPPQGAVYPPQAAPPPGWTVGNQSQQPMWNQSSQSHQALWNQSTQSLTAQQPVYQPQYQAVGQQVGDNTGYMNPQYQPGGPPLQQGYLQSGGMLQHQAPMTGVQFPTYQNQQQPFIMGTGGGLMHSVSTPAIYQQPPPTYPQHLQQQQPQQILVPATQMRPSDSLYCNVPEHHDLEDLLQTIQDKNRQLKAKLKEKRHYDNQDELEKIKRLRNEIEERKTELEDLDLEVERGRATVNRLLESESQLERERDQLLADNDQLRQEAEEQDRIVKSSDPHGTLPASNMSLRSRYQYLREEITCLEDTLAKRTAELNHTDKLLNQSKIDLQEVKDQARETIQRFDEARLGYDRTISDSDELERRAREASLQMIKATNEAKSLRFEVQELEKTKRELEVTLVDIQDVIANKDNDYQTLEQNVKITAEKLHKLERDLSLTSEKERERLELIHEGEHMITDRRSELEKLKQLIGIERVNLETIDKEIGGRKAELALLEDEHRRRREEVGSDLRDTERSMSSKQRDIREIQNLIDGLNEDKRQLLKSIDNLKTERDGMRADNDKSQLELETVSGTLSKNKMELKRLEDMIRCQQNELAKLRDQYQERVDLLERTQTNHQEERNELTALEASKKRKICELERLRDSVSTEQSALEELSSEKRGVETSLHLLNKEKEMLQETIRSLENKLSTMKRQLSQLEETILSSESRLDKLQMDCDSVVSTTEHHRNERDALKKQAGLLDGQVKQSNAELKAIRDRVTEYEGVVERTETEMRSKLRQRDEVATELRLLREQLRGCQLGGEQAVQRKTECEEEAMRAEHDLIQKRDQIRDANKTVAKLKREIELEENRLNRLVNESTLELNNLKADITMRQEELHSAVNKLAQVKRELEQKNRTEERLIELEKLVKEQETEVNTTSAEKQELAGSLNRSYKELAALREEFTRERESHTLSLRALETELEASKQSAGEARREIKKSKRRTARELEELERAAEEQCNRANRLAEDLNQARHDYLMLRKQVISQEELSERERRLEETLQSVRSDLKGDLSRNVVVLETTQRAALDEMDQMHQNKRLLQTQLDVLKENLFTIRNDGNVDGLSTAQHGGENHSQPLSMIQTNGAETTQEILNQEAERFKRELGERMQAHRTFMDSEYRDSEKSYRDLQDRMQTLRQDYVESNSPRERHQVPARDNTRHHLRSQPIAKVPDRPR